MFEKGSQQNSANPNQSLSKLFSELSLKLPSELPSGTAGRLRRLLKLEDCSFGELSSHGQIFTVCQMRFLTQLVLHNCKIIIKIDARITSTDARILNG